jgi:N-glycosylase/DNA lyase
MRGKTIDVELFDLRHTFESAQPLTFHADYDMAMNRLSYSSGKSIIGLWSSGSPRNCQLTVTGGGANAVREVKKRFRLSDDMKLVYEKINTDKFISDAIRKYEGMRLTLNDPWETTVCYIISQFNNVKRIRGIVKNIISRYGANIIDDKGNVIGKSFPQSDALINADIKGLMACGTGFRAKYIKSAAEYCTNNLDLYSLNAKRYDRLKENLMCIDGIGDKVADCIILMGYGDLSAFPIDVWVKRTVETVYFNKKEKRIDDIHEFADEMWKGYAGYAQQYLFWGFRQMGKQTGEIYEGVKQRY